ncbi:N-acetylglucosamine-6-phosphate deacetylase [Georgenia sp. EYE_87]|uniref:N-acetylglucosamine-6-phosphate deacetylase n=1 Tax=Georgenia sp. EYE_87 TaxID=2853448 RepID=UPI0020060F02|nr:N-acetylglucosamine-6-phosphate deacetylase [Georgenia sp. EYE_87]MCK6212641.1 N-acetylglucosamine-6-phosphate deacetylase [Georgenia sp. EYE_87]
MTSESVVRGRVVTPQGVIDDGAVVLEGASIRWVGPAVEAPGAPPSGPPDDDGRLVLPGLVDLHCHGGGGASFPDAETAEDVLRAVHEHRRHGTTSLVASLVTAAPGTLRSRVALLAGLADAGEIAGVHLEGPFLSVVRCGAQDPALIIEPDPALTTDLLELGGGHVVTMTVAPEHAGNRDGVAAALVAGGALPSWGHTDAGPGDTRAALEAGATLLAAADGARSARATVTHLFNGMHPLHHRDPGPIGEFLAAARRGDAVVELIADGTHLHPELVREVYELVGRDSVVLVTDAMAAAGMPDGAYRLGSQDVTVAGGVARLSGGGSIAGGTAHLLDVVRTTVAGGVPLVDAVYMASTGPARVLGDDGVGALEAGRRADLVVTDAQLRPVRVVRHGQEVTA